mgnify:CR=1 FL=1
MIKLTLKICCLLLLLFSQANFGQEDENVPKPVIVMQARAKHNAILLRWGVNDKTAWKNGNEYGYIVERSTVLRDGQPVQNTENIILTGKPIQPKPLAEWKSIVDTNDNAAIAAQAIYGEDFNTNSNSGGSVVMQVVNQSSELQQRFAFSMFAIDQSFVAAQYAGLGYIDKHVKPNEEYLYNIKQAIPEENDGLEEVGLTISPSSKNILPKPYDFAGYYYNDSFVLIWEYDALQHFYNAYNIEKSEDGIIYKKINKVPITKLSSTTNTGISFTDSIPKYEKKYWYRIKGKTIFDELSLASDTISLIAYKELLVAPRLKENKIISDKEVILHWSFAEDEAWKVTSFDVLRANKPIGPFTPVKENLENKTRSYAYNKLQEVNYFKIRAKGIAGDYKDSSPNMVQPIDSVPPIKPTGLKGVLDTLGIVQLSWDKNLELDLKGYAILRANRPNQEFTRLKKQEFKDNFYIDTINIKSFNKKVYYKVVALDNRYNESLPSDVITLDRPDGIPPSTPLFTGYEIKEEGVVLDWQKSESDDVAKQIIYRKQIQKGKQTLWQNIYETSDTLISSYLDKAVKENTKYVYTIVAVDTSNLESRPSPVISVITQAKLLQEPVKGLYAKVNREDNFIQLSWHYKTAGVLEIQLYKKEEGKMFTLFKTLEASANQIRDNQLTPNTIYTYGIKAVFKDGSISKWSEIEVKY